MGNFFTKVIIFAVAAPTFIYMSAKSKASAMQDYNISEAEEAVFNTCRSGLTIHDIHFSGGASDDKGCACLTKQASTTFSPKQFAITGDIVSIKLSIAEKQKELKNEKKAQAIYMDAIQKLDEIQAESKLSERDFFKVLDKTSEFIKLCGDRKSHTEENVSKWANYRTRGVPQERRQQERRQEASATTLPSLRK
ncbi:hypothetical protein ACJ3XI_06690 [Litorimonas sp. RW-G-Af-16]|uniref:hypothetical protein n=1 Tax=Litorimonas sp. RW-G-Af-16 TaxID=3241168 RepID=UPI00390C47A5